MSVILLLSGVNYLTKSGKGEKLDKGEYLMEIL